MRNRLVMVSIIVAALGGASLAMAASPSGTQVFRIKSHGASASACGTDEDALLTLCWNAGVETFTDGANGGISVEWTDAGLTNHRIECSGPSFGQVVSVHESKGNAYVFAVLDPDNSECASFNVDFAVTLSFAGAPDGMSSLSQNGTTKQLNGGITSHYNFRHDCFGETFVGAASIPGFGDFTGVACAGRNTR